MNDTKKELVIARTILTAQTEVITRRKEKAKREHIRAKAALAERRRRRAEQESDIENRRQHPLSPEDRQRTMSLLRKLNEYKSK